MLSTRRGTPLPGGLYAVCDDSVRPELDVELKATRLLEGGVRTLQLRLKRTPLRVAVPLARQVAALCRAAGAALLINDRVDLCLLAGAQGVHLGDEDLPVDEARRLLGPTALIGATVRHAPGARRAAELGASYAGIGPVFATRTKVVEAAPLGLARLREAVSDSPLPLVAISGIGLANIAEVAATGVHAAAVISDLLDSADIPRRARDLEAAFWGASGKVAQVP